MKSNISWFMLLYLFGILLTCAMEEKKEKINIYSVNQLQNDFIGLKKNPQKYVEFQLNAENTTNPDAGGLYELLPYYQKINPLGEKANYAIQWCDFENKWQLIKVNPLGDLPRLDVEQTTIATLLEGDHFSRPTDADIKAYTAYEQMKLVVKTLGEKNKNLKITIANMENESARKQTESENFNTLAKKVISSVRVKNKKQQTKLAEIIEENKLLKSDALEQKDITEKANELNKMKIKEYQRQIEEMETNLKEKEIQINKKNESINALTKQIGGLSFKLDLANEFEQNFKSLEKDMQPQKDEIKRKTATVKACEEQFTKFANLLNKQDAENQNLQENLKKSKIEIQFMREQLKSKDKEQKSMKEKLKSWKHENNLKMAYLKLWENEKQKDMEEEVKNLRIEMDAIINANHEMNKEYKRKTELQKSVIDKYSAEEINLNKKLERQQQLLDNQESAINLHENDLKLKEFRLNALMNNFYKYTFDITPHIQSKGPNTDYHVVNFY